MKKILWLSLVLGFSHILLSAASVQAVSLVLVPSSQTIVPPSVAEVQVDIVGLNAVVPKQIVSAYDLDLSYDPSILQATAVSFGPFLGASFHDFDLSTAGVVHFAELSLESDSDLALLQPDRFTLATLTFNPLQVGTSPLTFLPDSMFGIDVTGRNAAVLSLTAGGGAVTVTPEPGTWAFLGTGLLVLAGLRRRRFCLHIPGSSGKGSEGY